MLGLPVDAVNEWANRAYIAFGVVAIFATALALIASFFIWRTGAIQSQMSDERIAAANEAAAKANERAAVANEAAGTANERAAKLEVDAASARERAAGMEARVAELNLQIVKIKEPRSLNEAAANAITSDCTPFKGIAFDLASTDGDPETASLMISIANILLHAGWDLHDWSGNTMRYPLSNGKFTGVITQQNVAVTLHQSHEGALKAPAEALFNALNAHDIKANLFVEDWQDLAHGGTDLARNVVHVLIGRKTLSPG